MSWKMGSLSGGKRAPRRPKHNLTPSCEVCDHMPGVHDKPLVYEHNHGNGEHRGWVCHGCNVAMGMAGDNPDILVALAKYLEERGFTPTRSLPLRAPSREATPVCLNASKSSSNQLSLDL